LKYSPKIELEKQQENIKASEEQLKKELEEQKNNILKSQDTINKEVQKDSIQYMSIISAVVLFAAGTIDIFTKINDFKEKIQSTIALGLVLTTFVALIATVFYSEKGKIELIKSNASDSKSPNWTISILTIFFTPAGIVLILSFIFQALILSGTFNSTENAAKDDIDIILIKPKPNQRITNNETTQQQLTTDSSLQRKPQ
jgi:F0F1-type ATP synthase assembly protein I